MENPELSILIQRSIHEDRIRMATAMRRNPASGTVNWVRVVTGTMLMTIGARIAATPRPLDARPMLGELPVANQTRSS